MSTIFLQPGRGLASRAAYYRGQGLDGLGSRAAYYRAQGLDGLGFLPVAAASAGVPVVGPFIAAGSVFASIFGGLFGRDDQKTNYRPPSNTKEIPVEVGGQLISFDLSDLSTSRRNGNRDDDIFSYYSAFVSGNANQASEAARKVLENQARENGVSVREQAARILEYAGVRKIINNFLPSEQGSSSAPGSLPGYCPQGTYHPYPIGHPRQNECAPFPTGGTSTPGQTGPGQQPGGTIFDQVLGAGASIFRTSAAQRAAARAQQERLNMACMTGTFFDSTSQRCLPVPACGTGLIFDPLIPGCVAPGSIEGLDEGMPSWLWLVLLGLGLVVISR